MASGERVRVSNLEQGDQRTEVIPVGLIRDVPTVIDAARGRITSSAHLTIFAGNAEWRAQREAKQK